MYLYVSILFFIYSIHSRLTFKNTVSIEDTGGRSRKKHVGPSEGPYEEVDDSERGERGMQRP